MRVINYKRQWTISDCRRNPNWLFIFEDNDRKFGKNGSSVIRDEENSFGIPTKKSQDHDYTSYYTDMEFLQNQKKIDDSIRNIKDILSEGYYKAIVLPYNGIGSGTSKLYIKAPMTQHFLLREIHKLKDYVTNIEFNQY